MASFWRTVMRTECTRRTPIFGSLFPPAPLVNYFDNSSPNPTAWRRAVTRSLRALSHTIVALTLAALSIAAPAGAQRPRPPTGAVRPYTPVAGATMPPDSVAYAGLPWPELGPFRGGRSVAATVRQLRTDDVWR